MEDILKILADIEKIQKLRKELIEEMETIENERLLKQALFITNYGAKCES